MKTTIKTVAEYVGVSRGTVDRVLHNRGNVDSDVSRKVTQALVELNYKPNAIARALVTNRKITKLGFILPNESGFFHDEIHRAIKNTREEFCDIGIEIDVAECDAMCPEEYVTQIERMCEEDLCGLVICSQNSDLLIQKINELDVAGIPVITVNSDIPDSRRKCFIGEDAIRCGRVAAEIICKHLKEDEKILVVAGIPEFAGHQDRIRGFLEYLEEKGIPQDMYQIIYTYEKYDLTYDKIIHALREQPHIKNIYLGIESTKAYKKVLSELQLAQLPFVVSHDTADHTLQALKEGIFDFTIDQDMYDQGNRPLRMLIDFCLYEKPLIKTDEKIALHIVSSECID